MTAIELALPPELRDTLDEINARLARIEAAQVKPDLLTTAEAAEALKVSPSTVQRMKARGELKAQSSGKRLRFCAGEINQIATRGIEK